MENIGSKRDTNDITLVIAFLNISIPMLFGMILLLTTQFMA